MTALLFYTFVAILLGIFVKMFWPVLLIIWYGFLFILNLVVGSWMIAIVVMMCDFIINGNKWEGFNITWAYCAVFYTVLNVVYILIVTEIVGVVGEFIGNVFRK